MKRPTVGIVTVWCESGAGTISRTYRRLLSPVADVAIYARGGECDRTWDGEDRVYRAAFRGGIANTGIDPQEFEAWLKREAVDICIFNEQQDASILYAVAGRLPLIAYVDYYTPDSLPIFELYDRVICHTARHGEAMAWHTGRCVIPWCVFPDDFAGKPAGPEPHFIHNAGRLGINGRKGTLETIAAFQHVHHPEARLTIASQVEERELSPALRNLIHADRRITWRCGTYPSPVPYSWGNVYVYPAKLDGLGLTLLEAQAAGRAVLAPSTAPYTELMQAGATGSSIRTRNAHFRFDEYYWPEREVDVCHLTELMNAYVDDSRRIVREGRAARDWAHTERNWERWKTRFIEVVVGTLESQHLIQHRPTSQQLAARYQKPPYQLAPVYHLWRPILRALEGCRFSSVCLDVDCIDDVGWLRKTCKEWFGTRHFHVNVKKSSTPKTTSTQIHPRKHSADVSTFPFEDYILQNPNQHFDAVVIWKSVPRHAELQAACRCSRQAVICVMQGHAAGDSMLKALGFALLPTPAPGPAHAHFIAGIFKPIQPNRPIRVETFDSDC